MSSKPLVFLRTRFWGSESHLQTWPLDAKTAIQLLLCIALFSLVGWLYLTQASQMEATKYFMRQTVKDIEKLERQNAYLRYQIAELETLPRIEASARQLGLGPVKRTAYLSVVQEFERAVVATEPQAMTMVADPVAVLIDFWDEVRAGIQAWVGRS
jgi:hypothetical protein